MATYSRTRLAHTAVELLDRYPAKSVMTGVAQELIKAHKERELPLLLQDLATELWHTHRHLTATVISVHPLSPALQKTVAATLKHYYEAKTVEIKPVVDPSLIGGLIIKTPLGDLDTSLISQLNQLKTKML